MLWPGQGLRFVSQGVIFAYGGNKCVLRAERNRGKEGHERKDRGSEFQTVGAAKEKERRPLADVILGNFKRCLSADLRFRVGLCGVMSSRR